MDRTWDTPHPLVSEWLFRRDAQQAAQRYILFAARLSAVPDVQVRLEGEGEFELVISDERD